MRGAGRMLLDAFPFAFCIQGGQHFSGTLPKVCIRVNQADGRRPERAPVRRRVKATRPHPQPAPLPTAGDPDAAGESQRREPKVQRPDRGMIPAYSPNSLRLVILDRFGAGE
jgi:hypothetical protein